MNFFNLCFLSFRNYWDRYPLFCNRYLYFFNFLQWLLDFLLFNYFWYLLFFLNWLIYYLLNLFNLLFIRFSVKNWSCFLLFSWVIRIAVILRKRVWRLVLPRSGLNRLPKCICFSEQRNSFSIIHLFLSIFNQNEDIDCKACSN